MLTPGDAVSDALGCDAGHPTLMDLSALDLPEFPHTDKNGKKMLKSHFTALRGLEKAG